MGDFDIESYLEGGVDQGKFNDDKRVKGKKDLNDERDLDNSKRQRSRSRSAQRKNSRDRDSTRLRDNKYSGDMLGNRNERDKDNRSFKRRSKSRDRDIDNDRRDKYSKPQEKDPIDAETAKQNKAIADLTKDQRTILVGQLTMKVKEVVSSPNFHINLFLCVRTCQANLRDFFSQIGKVNSVIMIRDKVTGRHKGIAYVEMADLDEIPNCLLFNNVVPDFQKFPILVKPSEAEKNFVAKKETVASSKGEFLDTRVYVGNIHVSITDIALRSILEQFGPLESLVLHRDEIGNSKGYAFAKFMQFDAAKLAMSSLGGLELAGRPLKVGPVVEGSNSSSTLATKSDNKHSFMSDQAYNYGSGNWKLDDDESGGTGLQLNAQSRVQLMAKLGQAAGLTVPVPIIGSKIQQGQDMNKLAGAPVVQQGPPPISGLPSSYIMIQNMFTPEDTAEPNWDFDIREDLMEETSKYGQVLKCEIETRRPGGLVYVQFSSPETAARAALALHGRYFAGRMITVMYLDGVQFSALTS